MERCKQLITRAVLPLLLTACAQEQANDDFLAQPIAHSAETARCAQSNPLHNAYFGDLHVHTALSSDAWMFDVRVSPDEAYRYAFGETIYLPPNNVQGRGTRAARIDRPLDFMAVTDHAEFLGETALCQDASARGYESEFCVAFRAGEGRNWQLIKRIFSPFPKRDRAVCGENDKHCQAAARQKWREIIEAAEHWQDRSSACQRTTFIAYEYSSHRLGSNLHRNVIFANAIVPKRPISYIEAPREWHLWRLLDETCMQRDNGCQALAIPHNSNISNGRMFAPYWPGLWRKETRIERAKLRARLEPVLEIMQHKGDSECRNGLAQVLGGEDEYCDFEQFEDRAMRAVSGEEDTGACYLGPFADYIPHRGPDCLSPRSYARYAIAEGLRKKQNLGVNPFQLGFIAATDTHNGTGGGVEERSFKGHLGLGDDTAEKRLSRKQSVPGNASNNPGGLGGVWAEENSRQAIFAALLRREVFGTSGPRIIPRFFGSWSYPKNLCQQPEMITRAYSDGVAMGGVLPAKQTGDKRAPRFLAMASADPKGGAGEGNLLHRLQIIKVWPDPNGKSIQQRIYHIAGNDDGAPDPDQHCRPTQAGARQLCALWEDPDFDSKQPAAYYLRALETPSCRYTAWQAPSAGQGSSDTDVQAAKSRPEADGKKMTRELITERAWSSPIWYQ